MADLTVGRVEFGPPDPGAAARLADLPKTLPHVGPRLGEEVRREAFVTGFLCGLQHGLDLVAGTYETERKRKHHAELYFAEWQAYLVSGGGASLAWADKRSGHGPEDRKALAQPPDLGPAVATAEATLFDTLDDTLRGTPPIPVRRMGGSCRIDIVEYRRRKGGGYDVLFNGEVVGYANRPSTRWIAYLTDGTIPWSETHRTRGEAAASLIRHLYPEWQGTAP